MALSKYANSAAVDAALDKGLNSASEISGQDEIGYFDEISDTNEYPVHVVGVGQKKITWASIKSTLGASYIPTVFSLAEESGIVDDDEFPYRDKSVTALGAQRHRKSTWANIKSVLKTYFDTLYSNVGTTNGILKANGSGVISAASAGTDFQAAITATGILKGAGSGSVSAASNGTDYIASVADDTTPQLGGELDMNGKSIGGTETDNGNSGTSKAIDWRNGNHQKVTMTGNCTFTFTAPTKCGMLSLRLIQDATGSRTITLPTIKKVGGTAFTFSTAANAIDILSLYYDGSAYYGQTGIAWS